MSSETNTSASISTSATTTGNETVTLAEEIKKYDTEKLIEFLEGQGLNFKSHHFDVFRDKQIDGKAFLKMEKQDFKKSGFEIGPAIKLVDFAKECKEKKLRAFRHTAV